MDTILALSLCLVAARQDLRKGLFGHLEPQLFVAAKQGTPIENLGTCEPRTVYICILKAAAYRSGFQTA